MIRSPDCARAPGEHALLRQLFRGRIWTASPAIVVEDGQDVLALWLPPGVHGKAAEGDLFGEWTLRDHVFDRPNGILRLTTATEPYSVLLFRNDDGSFRGWYVNFERPVVRTPLGWDFEDCILDLWIEPDLRWRWLDEDELERAVALRLFSRDEVAVLRTAGEEALARARAGAPRSGTPGANGGRARPGRSPTCRPAGTGSNVGPASPFVLTAFPRTHAARP